jgi:hypothetical protein
VQACVLILAINGVLLSGQGNNGPTTTEGDLHRADPCLIASDNADGVKRECQFGHSAGIARADFNGDGIADLAAAAPNETRTNLTFSGSLSQGFISTPESGAGAVDIIYGSSNGLTTAGTQTLDQYLSNVSANAHFGAAMAAGKFSSLTQPYSDLAVAAPGAPNGGAIYIFKGTFSSATGSGVLAAQPAAIFFGNDFTGCGTNLQCFGGLVFPDNLSMVWGDFNGDGSGDLAVEINTCKNSCTNPHSGWVILFGSPSGLSETNAQVMAFDDGLSPGNFSPGGPPRCMPAGSHFCAISTGHISLAAADFNGDGKDDLVIGAPNCSQVDDSFTVIASGIGCVAIAAGNAPAPSRFFGWSAFTGVAHEDQHGTNFGAALAVGDFDDDGKKDLAVGAPTAGVLVGTVAASNAGSVRIVPGTLISPAISPFGADGFISVFDFNTTVINQNTAGLGGAQSGAKFGAALASNDFNGDGARDLAIGAPGETIGGVSGMGEVQVVYGLTGTGLSTVSSTNHPAAQTFVGSNNGSGGGAFGSALSAWNFGKSGEADLAIGEPFFNIPIFRVVKFTIEIVGFTDGAGAVVVFYGSNPGGLTSSGQQTWIQNSGVKDSAAAGNHFGATVY